jgi:hypothetical protein
MKRRITGYGIALAIGITGAGLGTAGWAASAASSGPSGTTATTPVTTTARAVVDVPGPCDEAEHANDPRCATTVAGGAKAVVIKGAGADDKVRGHHQRRNRGADRRGHDDGAAATGASRSGRGGADDTAADHGTRGQGADDTAADDHGARGQGADDTAADDHGNGGHGADDTAADDHGSGGHGADDGGSSGHGGGDD